MMAATASPPLPSAKNDQLRGYDYWAFTYADAGLDAKIAGERQGDEVSLYLTTAPEWITSSEWFETRPSNVYPTIHITRFYSSSCCLNTDDFKEQIFYQPRTGELDHGFFAVHGVDRKYVWDHYKLILRVVNDTLPI